MCRLCREEDVSGEPRPAVRSTITINEALELESGDWGGKMGDFPASTRAFYDGEWGWDGNDYEIVDAMIAEMETSGWNGPPVCVTSNTLHNGHHRTIAAYMAGLTHIPTTDDWDTSESEWQPSTRHLVIEG